MPREWRICEPVPVPPALRRAVGGHPLVARLLAQRGLTDPERARAFLDPSRYHPALPGELPGIASAATLVRDAIARGARLRIWGDFDADGVTATAVLYQALTLLGAEADYRLPSRAEGHGLPPSAIDAAIEDGVALLLTCDTGIAAHEAVARGKAAGLQVIITDHHDLPSELPDADAIVNPKMLPEDHPLRELSGVGVAYQLAHCLLPEKEHAAALEEMLDLVALGLVADVATQVGDVRYLIQRGLSVLRQTRRPGLRAMIESAGLDPQQLDEGDIGFQLGPRLNAAGRLDASEWVVWLLLTNDWEEAQSLAQRLEALNRTRQARTEALQAQVESLIARNRALLRDPAIILDGEEWEPGVLGLVAGNLAREYSKPVILIAHRKGQPSVASARSVEGSDIHAAIASQQADLIQEGGHPMAAGFSLERERLERVRQGILSWLAEHVPRPAVAPPLEIDAVVPWEEVDLPLARDLSHLGPHGPGNPRPLLMLSKATLIRTEDVSRQRETAHRRLYVNDDEGRPLTLVWFNAQTMPEIGAELDLAFHLGVQSWRGRERLQLELVDWRPALAALVPRWATIIDGREVVDWRRQADALALLQELQQLHGRDLCVWAEGIEPPTGVRAVTRAALPESCIALAVLTPPPGPEALLAALTATKPQLLYLLPPLDVPQPSPAQFLQQVAGMLRVALRDHHGKLDVVRMAARTASRSAAIIAACRGLEAAGKIVLERGSDGLYARLPSEDELQEEDSEQETMPRAERLAQARAALAYLLRETKAFRQAYATDPVETLLAGAF